MNKNKIVELIELVAEKLKKAGSDESSVSYVRNSGLELEFRSGKIETLKKSLTNRLNISIYKDGKFSSHSTGSLSIDDIENLIKRGLEITSYLNVDEFRSLPDPEYYADRKDIDLKLYDKSIENDVTEKKIEELKKTEEQILKLDGNIVSSTVGYSDNSSESILFNSNGFMGTKKTTSFSQGAEITLKDKDGRLIEDYHYATVRKMNKLPDPPEIAKDAVAYTVRKKGQSKIKSGSYETIVENRVVGNLLATLISPLSGKLIYQGRSYLENSFNRMIGSENLTIIEDPFLLEGLGSRLFDSEGITARKEKIVENGILKRFFIDSYYGKKLNREITSGSYSNLLIPKGDKSVEKMIKEIERGILITGFIGGNFNSTTGDFSYGITGLLIRQGKYSGAVNEMNITGNAIELWKNFKEAANDTYEFSRIVSPSLRFGPINFNGL